MTTDVSCVPFIATLECLLDFPCLPASFGGSVPGCFVKVSGRAAPEGLSH